MNKDVPYHYFDELKDSISMHQSIYKRIARNFGRSLRIPNASLQTSVNFPRTRPLKCMEQSAFLNQERIEMTQT